MVLEDALKELKTVYPQISIGIENLKKKKELIKIDGNI